MEIDSTPVPPPQEYSDSPTFHHQPHSESSMNFDYLSSLNRISGPDDVSAGGGGGGGYGGSVGMGASSPSCSRKTGCMVQVDDRAADRPFDLNERFVGVLDQLDARVEKFRKDAMGLQEKRDYLLMSIDLIKTNDLLQGMSEAEREEISCYIQRVNSRLSTVELNVRTVRDTSQEDSLSQVNMLIDMMITMGDPVLSRQRCQEYLNACSSFDSSNHGMDSYSEHTVNQVVVDKKFECALLGCTLDDQKNIKRRLQALMGYLNKQTIRD